MTCCWEIAAFAPTRRSPLWPHVASTESFACIRRGESIFAKAVDSVPMIASSSGSSPPKLPQASSDEEFAALPPTLTLRMIRLRVAAEGFRNRSVTVVTTLTDPQPTPPTRSAPSTEKRWNVELHFHQIKTLMARDVLRCQSPEMIEKELLVHLIAYNLVRVLMQKSAHSHHAPLNRISFKATLDTSRHFADVIHAAAKTPRKQQALIDEMLALIATHLIQSAPVDPTSNQEATTKELRALTKPRSQMGNLPHRNRPNRKASE